VHHPSTPKEKVLGFLHTKIYEEFHKRYFEAVTLPPSWDRYTINSLKTRQYAVHQMANWHIRYYKPEEGFETLCDKYWKESFEKYSSHNKQKITNLLFHINKHVLINIIIKNFIPEFDSNNHRQLIDDHLKSLKTPPPCSAVFNYCQAMFGTDYAMTHTDDIIL